MGLFCCINVCDGGGGALVNNAGSFILCPSAPVSFGGTATVHTGSVASRAANTVANRAYLSVLTPLPKKALIALILVNLPSLHLYILNNFLLFFVSLNCFNKKKKENTSAAVSHELPFLLSISGKIRPSKVKTTEKRNHPGVSASPLPVGVGAHSFQM